MTTIQEGAISAPLEVLEAMAEEVHNQLHLCGAPADAVTDLRRDHEDWVTRVVQLAERLAPLGVE